MPNVEADNKSNAPSSNKKEKRKSLAVTTEKDVSSLLQETLSPITPALETDSSENVNKNPYIDVINKRVKNLKKKMIKIEKYETIQNSTDPNEVQQLNADQIKVLERKGEVSGAIKEFDETLKQIEGVEKEELKKQAELKKAQQAELEQAITDSVEEVKAANCKSLLQLILFFRLVDFQLRGIIQLSDNECEAVETLRAKLTTLSEEAENDELYEEKTQQVLDLVNKLHLGDEDLITKSLPKPNGVHETDEVAPSSEHSAHGISYSQLRSLIQNPPILESSGDQDEAFEIIPNPETIQSEQVDVTNEYSAGLQFMRSDDQSQPKTFDTTINTTYGYQNIDAEHQISAAITGDAIHNVQEQYNQQQQNFGIYAVEPQQQHFAEQQYIGEQQQQHFVEQNDQQQQISTEQEESSQQDEPLSVQEPQITSEDQIDSKQPQSNQQNNNQPPPLSQGSGGHRGGRFRGRGHRGQGNRRESGGYNNYNNNYYRDGGAAYGSYRGGRGGQGPRGGRGGGFQGNRGTSSYRQRSQ